jgi:hypothetical protein
MTVWNAFSREAGLAAEHLGIGVTALGRANYAEHAYYAQSFFALSIGLERASKLALVVKHAVDHNGSFPSNNVVRGYQHKLRALLDEVDTIGSDLELHESDGRLPRTPIHDAIIAVLSDFASNITRYYNIDVITGGQRGKGSADPIGEWHDQVTARVLTKHETAQRRTRAERNARALAEGAMDYVLVMHHSETGEPLQSVFDASLRSSRTAFARPFERLYVLQIVRFLGSVLSELGYVAQQKGIDGVPYLSEFFAIYRNDDKYLKSRKTWSIYNR